LIAVAKLSAPFAPFISEELYRNLNSVTKREAHESVHLALMPDVESNAVDRGLEVKMERAMKIVELVRALRMKSNLKVRQPLTRIILPIASEKERHEVELMRDVILDEINVKKIEFVTDESGIVRKKAKANFKSIGPKFGKSAQPIANRIKEMTTAEVASLELDGSFAIALSDSTFTIGIEDVEIIREDIQGWLVESDGGLTVALDTALTEELVNEGFAREFINRIQNMRKDAGFEVTDRIAIQFRASERLSNALRTMREYIKNETLAVELIEKPVNGKAATQEINGESADILIEKRT
jgi:isoleucyl-tRNA synthetase